MYALETCVCSGDMLYAVWTWDMLYGHGRCLLVGEEYVGMEDVFLLEKNIWLWKMSSGWIRRYGYGRCLLFEEKNI